MKGFSKLFAVAVIAVFCGCQVIDSNFFPAVSRIDTQRRPGESDRDSILVPSGNTSVSKADTEIFCTAVRFPPSYDWRKDITNGTASCEILLYRNGKIERIIPAGRSTDICSDSDMHHLIGHDIFTEYSTMDQTVITKNGDEVVRFEGCEMLKGLVDVDGDIYTLSVGRDGHGFSYRKNGNILLKKDYRVHVFGSLEDPSCPETGALYEDERNNLIFCYRESNAHYDCHMVKNGIDQPVLQSAETKILDMKVIEDSVVFAEEKAYGAVWEEAYIPYHTPDILAGCVDGNAVVYDKIRGEFTMLCGRDAVIYCNENVSAALYHPTRGRYSIYYTTGECRFHKDSCHFFTRRCAALVGESLMVAVTPVDCNISPYLSFRDTRYELEGLGNGYITGFRATVSQTN